MAFSEYLSLNYPWLGLALVVSLPASVEVGRRLGAASQAADATDARGVTAAEGAVFALSGLLLAFTFSSATSRFEQRRDLVVQEANAILDVEYPRRGLIRVDSMDIHMIELLGDMRK